MTIIKIIIKHNLPELRTELFIIVAKYQSFCFSHSSFIYQQLQVKLPW
jgi:hypothetical protein